MKFEELKGKTLIKIEGNVGNKEMFFTTSEDDRYKLYHSQDCCEYVSLEEIVGDLEDLLFSPILLAEEVTHRNETPEGTPAPLAPEDSYTWTFYKLSTIKGSVAIRWYGESSGYYSEEVDFVKL